MKEYSGNNAAVLFQLQCLYLTLTQIYVPNMDKCCVYTGAQRYMTSTSKRVK